MAAEISRGSSADLYPYHVLVRQGNSVGTAGDFMVDRKKQLLRDIISHIEDGCRNNLRAVEEPIELKKLLERRAEEQFEVAVPWQRALYNRQSAGQKKSLRGFPRHFAAEVSDELNTPDSAFPRAFSIAFS